MNGPFFFGAADKFKNALARVQRKPRVLILRLRNVPVLDATALQALAGVEKKARREGTTLVLSGVHAQPLAAMEHAGFLVVVGEQNVLGNIDDALDRARALLDLPPPVSAPLPSCRRRAGKRRKGRPGRACH